MYLSTRLLPFSIWLNFKSELYSIALLLLFAQNLGAILLKIVLVSRTQLFTNLVCVDVAVRVYSGWKRCDKNDNRVIKSWGSCCYSYQVAIQMLSLPLWPLYDNVRSCSLHLRKLFLTWNVSHYGPVITFLRSILPSHWYKTAFCCL